MGHRVIAAERSPVIALLLEDARRHAARSPALAEIWARIELRCGDSRSLIPGLEPPPEVIYIDPLFPPKRKSSALPPRPIQLLRRLVGADPEPDELLQIALEHCGDRVVVKRPMRVPASPRPTVSYAGKLVRYDVYYAGEARRSTAADAETGGRGPEDLEPAGRSESELAWRSNPK
jgi:16S rRNA (guanine1516-N2)-methyltransferase